MGLAEHIARGLVGVPIAPGRWAVERAPYWMRETWFHSLMKETGMKNIYAFYDKVSKSMVGPLVVERHHAPVVRLFHDLLNNPKSQMHDHPADFSVVLLGKLDDDSDEFQLFEQNPETITSGAAWLAEQESRNNG